MNRLGRRAFLSVLACATTTRALGRTPISGALRLRLPFYFGGLDPHALDDPLSALLAPAISDALFALDTSGRPYPTLAQALPEPSAQGTRIRLRPELISAHGKPLRGADVLFSLKRAREFAGAAVLGAFQAPARDATDDLAVLVPNAAPEALARALASPLTAIVPRGFTASNPDGSGAFQAALGPNTLTLTRNLNAARGPAFLDRIELSRASDLADALRAFETGQVDVGWLGNGLYRPRAGALPLEGPLFGWIVLRTGLDAKGWGAPGIAQQLAASIPVGALTRFGVRAEANTTSGVRWGGGPCALLVSDDTPLTVELARALEPLLSSPGNDVRATPVPRTTWLEARRTRRFGLLIDFVRAANDDAAQSIQTLLAAVDPALAKRPPQQLRSLEDATRTLPLGVIGGLHISGSRDPRFETLDTWQLGNVWLNPEKS